MHLVVEKKRQQNAKDIQNVPKAKAAKMTAAQKRSAVKRKRSKAQGVGGKPTRVRTYAKKKRKSNS